MEMSFFRKHELQKARKRWQWAYLTAYVNAVYAAVYGFIITDHARHTIIGFDPVYTSACLIYGLVLAALAWGIQKRLSLICLSLFLVIVVLSIIGSSADDETPTDAIVSAFVAVMLFRGIVGIREMKKAMRESKQQAQGQPDQHFQPAHQSDRANEINR
jgi:peptidoglycan/LPS O-acetylase OafA/YrhL